MALERASANITLRTFVVARWVLLGLIALGWAVQLFEPVTWEWIRSWFPPPPEAGGTLTVMVILAAVNLATQRWILGPGRATIAIAGAHLIIDATALTALLALSGGASNPFTTMFFVPITLSTQLSPRWTWGLAIYCLAAFAVLFAITPGTSGGHHMVSHLRGMWVAFAISGAFMTYFVHRIALSLSRQREELARLRDEATQDRHLAAVGTLAAGAAHELGSPLGTISALVGDLEQMDASERAESIAAIRQSVRRCKHIISQMASPELRVPTLARERAAWPLGALCEEIEEAEAERPVDVVFTPPSSVSAQTWQPRPALGQIVRELISNGVEACRQRAGSSGVHVEIGASDGTLELRVIDDGVGMSAEAARSAFNPFYTTRDGMGLGLYLARAHLRQLGGEIELESRPGVGTTVRIRAPLEPPLDGS